MAPTDRWKSQPPEARIQRILADRRAPPAHSPLQGTPRLLLCLSPGAGRRRSGEQGPPGPPGVAAAEEEPAPGAAEAVRAAREPDGGGPLASGEFSEHLLPHPVMIQLLRLLVRGSCNDPGQLIQTFRVKEGCIAPTRPSWTGGISNAPADCPHTPREPDPTDGYGRAFTEWQHLEQDTHGDRGSGPGLTPIYERPSCAGP